MQTRTGTYLLHGMMKSILSTVALSLLFVPLPSMAGDLQPCASPPMDGYRETVLATIDAPYRNQTLVSFTEFPSFSSEWGIRIIERGKHMRLRVVEFQDSVWYSASKETESGYFEQDLSSASYRRLIRDTALSADTARLLQSVVSGQVLSASAKEGLTMGFDGTTYIFGVGDACAEIWSPEATSRAGKIIDVFNDLRIQAAIPSRFLQLGLERRIHARLLALEGRRMSIREYFLFATMSLAVIAFAALPLLVATFFAVFKPALPRKRWYILSSAALTYGIACISALPFFVFAFVGAPLSSQLDKDGHAIASTAVHWMGQAAMPVVLSIWFIAMFLLPALLRRRWRGILSRPAPE